MVSDRKIAANRANARRSTGPKTARGKARSSRNGLKHGLAGRVIVLTGRERAALKRRLASWSKELEPEGVHQETLIGRAVLATVILDRIRAIDEANWSESLRAGQPPDPAVFRLVARYDSVWSNVLHRSLKAFHKAKSAAKPSVRSSTASRSGRGRIGANEAGISTPTPLSAASKSPDSTGTVPRSSRNSQHEATRKAPQVISVHRFAAQTAARWWFAAAVALLAWTDPWPRRASGDDPGRLEWPSPSTTGTSGRDTDRFRPRARYSPIKVSFRSPYRPRSAGP